MRRLATLYFFFFFNDTATTEIYTLSLHDALPILGELRQFSSATCDICDEAVARMLATFTAGLIKKGSGDPTFRSVEKNNPSNFCAAVSSPSAFGTRE